MGEDTYGTPLEIEQALKSLRINPDLGRSMGRVHRKNEKDYGRPSKWSPSRVRAHSWDAINRRIEQRRANG
jgi:hypothetical protein